MKSYDVIVIGLGAMGSSTSYYFAKRGLSVLGLEQFQMAHAEGSSHGKTRLIRKAYFEHPSYVPLLNRSYELWDALEKVSGKKLFHQTGLTIFGSKESEILNGVRKSSQLYSIPTEELGYLDCKEKFPQFEVPKDFLGISEPSAGYLEIENCIETYCKEALKLGADLKFETKVKAWKNTNKQFTVETSSGSFSAKYGVFTAGPWTNELISDLPLKVHHVPQYWFESSGVKNSTSFAFDMPYGFMYGFPDIKGLTKVAAHIPGDQVLDLTKVNRTPSPKNTQLVTDFVTAHLKCAKNKPVESSVCLYTMTPDQNFIVDLVKDNDNLACAAGFSGHGFKFASVMGETMTQLLLKDKKGCDIAFLRQNRF